ncbi:MAG: FtsW/RodA/SpoVE family cell cycle protein, partial [Fidelibacterota bacterium]
LSAGVLFAGFAAILSLLQNEYQRNRIWSWIHSNSNLTSTNWQSYNSKIALGNGGLTGTGLGDGMMKHGYIPEAHTDFIYSVIGEELGVVISILILGLFLWLFLRSVKIAQTAPDHFGMFLALGIGLNIALYCIINVAYVCGIFPTTGLPLPFISYGGTSTVIVLASMGILLNISNKARNPKFKFAGVYRAR